MYEVRKRYVISLAALTLFIISLLPAPALLVPLAAQPVESLIPENRTAQEVLQAKVFVMNNSLVRALSLNISDEVRSRINELIAVNISELSVDDVREWLRNASSILSRIATEVKEGRAYEVGITLQRYLNGLRVALENRVRTLARHYNITLNVEELIANTSKAKDINQLVNTYKDATKRVEEMNAWQFRERIEEMVRVRTQALQRGEVSILEKTDEELSKAVTALEKVMVRLNSVNASQNSIEAVNDALERIRNARQLIQEISKEVVNETIVKPERVVEAVRNSLELMAGKVNQSLNELIEELKELKEESIAGNLTVITSRIEDLIKRVEDLKSKINSSLSKDDVYLILDEMAKIKLMRMRIEEEVRHVAIAVGEGITYRVKELANVRINEAKQLLEEVEELRNQLGVPEGCENNADSKQLPLMCKTNITKLITLIDEKISEAKELIENAEKLYNEGNYTKALAEAVRSIGILNAAKAQLEALLKFAAKLPEAKEVTPPPPKPEKGG
ncbi:MAG: hypothetical protein QXN19_03100 [Sulfolobales archaeon]